MLKRFFSLWEDSLRLRREELQLQRQLLEQMPALTREAFHTSQLLATAAAKQSEAQSSYFSSLAAGYNAYAAGPAGPQRPSPAFDASAYDATSEGPASDELLQQFLATLVEGEGSPLG